jgi:hypothetical protein
MIKFEFEPQDAAFLIRCVEDAEMAWDKQLKLLIKEGRENTNTAHMAQHALVKVGHLGEFLSDSLKRQLNAQAAIPES